ncbi:MAG TPA: O-antigen ligase family protein [Methyloceanibacter sp.]|nr:O-antigen ligase family protein [Methyloceanibacter sp.]
MSRSAVSPSGAFRGGPIIPVLYFIVPLLTAMAPRLTPFLLLLLALVLIVAGFRRGLPWRALIKPNAAMAALIAIALYAALSAAWAVDPRAALATGALFAGATVATFAAATAIPSLDPGQVRRASLAFVAGVCCATLFVTIELVTDGALTRGVMNAVSILQPHDTKRVRIEDGRVTDMRLAELNLNVSIVAFMLWPGLLAVSALVRDPRRRLLRGLYLIALTVPIFLSEHDSSQIGVIASALILPLAWVNARAVIRGLALAWCLGFVLVLPLAFLAYKAALHRADWLPTSAQARIIIWEYTAERVLERPLLGIGADSTPAARAKSAMPAEKPKGFVLARTTGHHAHNLFLQSWYELGLLGAILAAVAGAATALRILLLPEPAQPFGAAAFTLFAVMAAFAWGMWQVWLVAAVGLLALYLLMTAAPYPRQHFPDTEDEP